MKERLDVLLVEKGLFPSREKAKASVMAGLVFVDGKRVDKAGTMTDPGSEIVVKGDDCPYVSRGGLKLKKAIDEFGIDLEGKVCCDMGASTGGFTDCMLREGARKVYAVDVGYGQLAYKLREDPRVVNIERTNIRYMDTDVFAEPVDFISIDVSFISLKLILPIAEEILSANGMVLCLIKPQFEAGREEVGKNGVVRDPEIHEKVIKKTVEFADGLLLYPMKLTYSPIKGAKGNIEYLLCIGRNFAKIDSEMINITVKSAHQYL